MGEEEFLEIKTCCWSWEHPGNFALFFPDAVLLCFCDKLHIKIGLGKNKLVTGRMLKRDDYSPMSSRNAPKKGLIWLSRRRRSSSVCKHLKERLLHIEIAQNRSSSI